MTPQEEMTTFLETTMAGDSYDPALLPEKIPVHYLYRVLGTTHDNVMGLIHRGKMPVTVHDVLDRRTHRYINAWVDREAFLAWGRETHRLTQDNRPNEARLADIARGATRIDYGA